MSLINKILACLGFNSTSNSDDEFIGKLSYDEGIEHLEIKNLEGAFVRFLTAANMGYSLAYYLVAGYLTNNPYQIDRSRALHYYSKGRSCKGFPNEFHRLGALYYLGELPGNHCEKMKFYCKYVNLILTDKQKLSPKELYSLGLYYFKTTKIMKELVSAAICFCKAAKLGDVASGKILVGELIPELEKKIEDAKIGDVEGLKVVEDIKHHFNEGNLVIDKDGKELQCIEMMNEVIIDVVCDFSDKPEKQRVPNQLVDSLEWAVKQLKNPNKENDEVVASYALMENLPSKTTDKYYEKYKNIYILARKRHPMPKARDIVKTAETFSEISEMFIRASKPALLISPALKPVTYLYSEIKGVLSGQMFPDPIIRIIVDASCPGSFPPPKQHNEDNDNKHNQLI